MTPGQAAYEKWTEQAELAGEAQRPPYSALPASQRDSWEQIAVAAINVHSGDGGIGLV